MGEGYPDNWPSFQSNDDEYKEKTRIAEVAAATLCRLNGIMKQMKGWRDDRVKLRSNIWRLKLALRVAGRETGDVVHAEPLIEHQRAEIKRLETSNQELKKELFDIKTALAGADSVARGGIAWKADDKLAEVKQECLVERERLYNEIRYLKSRLNEVEDGHEHSTEAEQLKCKLKHFMMVDHTMEIIFTDIVNKVAETIANLSEELVNTNERFHETRLKNDRLHAEVDKLQAMLRSRSGSVSDYRERIGELDDLTARIRAEFDKFKESCFADAWSDDTARRESLEIVERLARDLKGKLEHDHEALFAAGDPDRFDYMRKIVRLRVTLRQLQLELGKFVNEFGPRNAPDRRNYPKQLSALGDTLTGINAEIERLRNDHVATHCRIGGISALEYLNKIETLGTIVQKARATMNGLSRETTGKSSERKGIEKLQGFVGKVCHGIRELEVIVAAGDRSDLVRRIEESEELVVRLRAESLDKDNRVELLNQELCDVECLLGQKIKELDECNKQCGAWKRKAAKLEERMAELQRVETNAQQNLEQLQQLRQEVYVARKKLQNLQNDKDALLKEVGKIRDHLQKKSDQIREIQAQREATEKMLNAKIMDLTRRLQASIKENEKLQGKLNEFEQNKSKDLANLERERLKHFREGSQSFDAEVKKLRANLATSMDCLENANREIVELRAKLGQSVAEKEKLGSEVHRLSARNNDLTQQLAAEKSSNEERLSELGQLKFDYEKIDLDRANSRKEREQFAAELSALRFDKDVLQKSLDHIRSECATLQEDDDHRRTECENLREENRNRKNAEKSLNGRLKDAGDKISQLELENSRLRNDLEGFASKSAGFEGQLRLLLSEKKETADRIVDLTKANAELVVQLNEARTAERSFTSEFNELKTQQEKTISETADLRRALDAAKEANGELKRKLCEMERAVEVASRTVERRESWRQPMAENESLKLELDNLQSRNGNKVPRHFKFLGQDQELAEGESAAADRHNPSKLEIVNLFYKEINSYSNRCSEHDGALARTDHSGLHLRDGSRTEQELGLELAGILQIVNALKVENVALKVELNSMRSNAGNDDRTRSRLLASSDEIEALKTELTKLREERESLRDQLATGRTKLLRLECEKEALKDELYVLRRTNSELKHRVNEIRCHYQKQKERNTGLENCIMKTIKKIKKYTMSAESEGTADGELKLLLKEYISNEEILRAVEHRMDARTT